MKLLAKTIQIGASHIEIGRDESGVPLIIGDDPLAIQRGIGYVHAKDRLMQLIITRIVAEGRLCECLLDNDDTFSFDHLMRKLGFRSKVEKDLINLTHGAREWAQAYCEGISNYIEKNGYPFVCKMLKIKPEPWTIADTMMVLKLQMYIGLAQTQERSERFIIQAIHDGVSIEKLKILFHPFLDELDSDLISLIRKVPLEIPYLDEEMVFMPGMSNNWALSPSKSSTGSALLCNDPHLQISRLPAIWYEVMTQTGDEKRYGVTAPGVPGMVIGRSNHLSIGITYGMMDVIDFFIEGVEEESVKRPHGKGSLEKRIEIVKRKNESEELLYFYESDSGVLERRDATEERIEDGCYFSFAWATQKRGVAPSINAMEQLWKSQNVQEGQAVLREIGFSFNWVLADSQGNIGYQQSGSLPIRKHSGLYPVAAWEEGNLWNGFLPSEKLASEYNPKRGYVVSANDDKHRSSGQVAINLPMSPYRYERICSLLSQNRTFSLEEMKALQSELYSIQAATFMEFLSPLLPDTPVGKLWREWDCCYDVNSKGATLFEDFYQTLILDVFGKVFGAKGWEEVVKQHSLLVFLHGHFDRILLAGEESWFGKEGREACFRRILQITLEHFQGVIPPWGEKNQFRMHHLLFEGKLTKYFGKGPYPLVGSRSTVSASYLFQEHKRGIAAGASYRFACDMGEEGIHSALCGGVTEGRFSPYYISDLPLWLNFKYKRLK